ncbi:uncharacterized protein O3C94_015664 [Discoglossus pictus]
MMDEKHQTLRTEGISGKRSSGLHDYNLFPELINEEGQYERDERDIQQVKIPTHTCAASDKEKTPLFSTLHQEEINMRSPEQIKEEEIPVTIGESLHEKSMNTISVIKEEEDEMDEKDILQVTIQSDADGSMNMNALGQNHDSNKDVTRIYPGAVQS